MTLKIGGLVDIIHAFDTESTSLAAIISLDVWKMRNSHYISVKSKVWQISAAEQAIQICNLSNSLQESFCKPPPPPKKIQSITGFILSTSDSCEGYSRVCYVNKISGSHMQKLGKESKDFLLTYIHVVFMLNLTSHLIYYLLWIMFCLFLLHSFSFTAILLFTFSSFSTYRDLCKVYIYFKI